MTELSKVWNQVEWLHNAGLSLIPVRDKAEGEMLPKTPYRGWKKYQSEQITIQELWYQMEHHNTEAVSIIAGAISGNLEIIDIDVKYKPGIDAVLMSDLNKFYPELFARLRIHKTPSGGYHILYRTSGGSVIPGNQKLAGRPKTEAELKAAAKPSTVNFIETRGEGGYALAPPSLGYSIHQDTTIPVITWEERCSIINICKSYSEIIEIEKPPKATKSQSDYYDEDPFTHFNNSPAAESILLDYGWKEVNRQSNQFVWYTRPDKAKGTSASFNKSKRIYYIFTSSTELDEMKGYNPATLLALYKFSGDFKETYRWLVQNGYGKIKREVEDRIVKSKAVTGKPLPSNVSQSAKINYEAERVHIQTTYPYGIFWDQDEDGNYRISRELLYVVSEGLGWRLFGQEPVRIQGYIVHRQTPRNYFDDIKAYIKEDDGDIYIEICNAYESFIQKNGAFTIQRLPYLDESQIVKDTSNSAYKFYNNGYLFITATGIRFNTYDTLSGLIWHESIIQRQYNEGKPSGRYIEFLKLATPFEQHSNHISRCIGYLAHQYKDETTGYIIVLTEQCQDAKNGGGSGKNIFSSLFGQTTTYRSIPGSQVRYDEKFLQSWNGERVFAVSDVPKKFDFSFLKELSTGSGLLKKLFKDETSVSVEQMPKFIIQTNFCYEVSDGGLRRRLIPIEFTDHFTKCGGVDVHFGCHFPKGWELQDWTGYDNFIAECIKEWLSGGLKLYAPALTEGGWHKQFEQTWGQVITGIITDLIDQWIEQKWVSNDTFRTDIDAYFKENNTPLSFRPSMARLYEAIAQYCKHNEKQFKNNLLKRNEIGQSVKHKWFGEAEDTPF